jgi:CRP-like cAMP-binding protein
MELESYRTNAVGPARKVPQNRLLANLKPRDLDLLAPHLEIVTLKSGTVLFEPGEEVTHAHFPKPGTIGAIVITLNEGGTAEAAMVGQEGALGGIISQGEKPAFGRGLVQIGGEALRLSTEKLDSAKQRSPALRDHFARYADCLLAQVLQSVACNAVHDLDARLARWLLTLQDRLQSDELRITQEFISQMLGVHRPYTTRIIGDLEKRGAIEKTRGAVTVKDRKKLERNACECYDYLRRHFERVLPGVYPG